MESKLLSNYFTTNFKLKVLLLYKKEQSFKCLAKIKVMCNSFYSFISSVERKSFDFSSVPSFRKTVLKPLTVAREKSLGKKINLGKRHHLVLQKRLLKSSTLFQFIAYFPPSQRHIVNVKACDSLKIDPSDISTLKTIPGVVLAEVPIANRRADVIGIFSYRERLWLAVLEYKTSSCIKIKRYSDIAKQNPCDLLADLLRKKHVHNKEHMLVAAHAWQVKDTSRKVYANLTHCSEKISQNFNTFASDKTRSCSAIIDSFVWTACKTKQVRNIVFHVTREMLHKFHIHPLKRSYMYLFNSNLYDSIVKLVTTKQCSRRKELGLQKIFNQERERTQVNNRRLQNH